jgi:hypothetical protein
MIDATQTADKSLAQIAAADYLIVQGWTGARWKPTEFAFLAVGKVRPTDLAYSPHQWMAGVGLGAGTYRMKIPDTLSAGTYRLALSVSTLAAGAHRFSNKITRMTNIGVAPLGVTWRCELPERRCVADSDVPAVVPTSEGPKRRAAPLGREPGPADQLASRECRAKVPIRSSASRRRSGHRSTSMQGTPRPARS